MAMADARIIVNQIPNDAADRRPNSRPGTPD
jgi:hypothetical protein